MNIAYKFYLNKLKNILTDCYNHKKEKIRILDLGCGDLSINPILNCGFDNFTSYVGIDAFKFDFPSNLSKDRISFINKNIFQISDTFDRKSFDIVFALDLIEHLEIKDGEKLIELMKKLAVHNIIFLHPTDLLNRLISK